MASLYDILTVEDKQYYRMNKNIVPKDKVPAEILKQLTPDNVIDENGMVVVDEKAGPAQEATAENLEEIKKASEPAKPTAGAEDTSDENQKDEAEESGEDSEEEDDDSSTEDSEDEDTDDGEDGSEPDEDEGDKPAAQEPKPQAPAKPARTPASKPVAAAPVFKSAVPQSRPGMGFPRVNGKTVDIFDGKTPHTHLKLIDGVTVPLSAESFRTRNDIEIRNKLKELGIATLNFAEIEAAQNAAGANGNAGNADSLLLDDSEADDNPTQD